MINKEQVEKVWRGCEWCNGLGKHDDNWECPLVDDDGHTITENHMVIWTTASFCPVCGKPLTDEAVEMVMERMEKLYEQTNN